MKKAILKTSGMLLVVGLAFTAMLFGCKHKTAQKTEAEQQTESVNPAIFTTDGNGKITGYTCSSEELPKNLVIPAKIGDEVITSIGSWAFDGCSDLTSVTVDNGNSTYKAVDNVVYTKDRTTLVFAAGGLTSVTIPSTVTSIGDMAFSGCSGLTSVNFPASLTSIGYHAFWNCNGLTSVNFPASLTSIGKEAFWNCNGLTSVSLSSCTSLTSIGASAFESCEGLTSVSFPASLTSIGANAFSGCSGLTSVSFPASLTSIGERAFDYCSGLTSVNFPASLTSIGDEAFSSCLDLTSVSFPARLTSIGNYAFSSCLDLTSVSFPASLTSIGKDAFSICYNLTSATFADAAGWAVYNDNKYKNKATNIQQSDLESPATAAKYLRKERDDGGYSDKWWKKN